MLCSFIVFFFFTQVSHHTRPGECEVDSDPPPPPNNSSVLSKNEEHDEANLAAPDVNNSTLNTSEEIGSTADLEDCDIHSEHGKISISDYMIYVLFDVLLLSPADNKY